MIARWDSKCSICSKPVKAGTDVHYDAEAKQVSHWECRENPQPTAEQYELAARLGFIGPGERVRTDWLLWDLHKADNGGPAGRLQSTTHQRSNGNLFDEDEE